MKYMMKAGVLYEGEKKLARLKGNFNGPEKKIFLADERLALRTNIRSLEARPERSGDVRNRRYVMVKEGGETCACAEPEYSSDDDPELVGWPVCRMPRVDHARFFLDGQEYCMVMENSQNYCLKNQAGNDVMRIVHRGLAGGWNIEAGREFSPAIICGIFVFCRYMEQENEFLTV